MFSHKIDENYELRLLEPRYAQMIFSVVEKNRGHLSEWLSWVAKTKSPDDVSAFIQSELERFVNNDGFTAGIFCKNEYIGNIGLHGIDWEHRKTSIGYWISARTDNYRSRAIPERLGFTQEGILRQVDFNNNQYHDHVVYGVLASEWR